VNDTRESSPRCAGRWFRFAWLERLPLLGHLFRRSRRAPPRRPSPPLLAEQLEERRVFNDPIGMAQTTVLGTGLAFLVPTIGQVALHGWGFGQPDFDPNAVSYHASGALAEMPWASAGDVSFAPLQVVPAPEPTDQGSLAPWAEYQPSQPPREITLEEPPRLVTAEEALRASELVSLLDQVKQDLQGPLPASQEQTGLHDDPSGASLSGPTGGEGGTGGGGGGSGGGVPSDPPAAHNPAGVGSSEPATVQGPNAQTASVATTAAPATVGAIGTQPAAPAPTPAPVVGASFSGPVVPVSVTPPTTPKTPPAPPVLQPGFGNLPLAFEPNLGQADSGTAYVARGQGYSIGLDATGIRLAVQAPAAAGQATPAPEQLRINFAGADPSATLQSQDLLPGRSNYFLGGSNPLSLTDVPQYGQVSAPIAPGVSVVFHGNGKDLQFDFQVAPGADPSSVNLTYSGAQSVGVDGQGNVALQMASGTVLQQAPTIYQTVGGHKQVVGGRYVDQGNGRVGFQVDGPYDPTRPLVLDPTLSFSTYLGGGDSDVAHGVATDFQGNTYVVGTTSSTNFPTLNGYQDSQPGGGSDAFVTKYGPSGALAYSTYLGGVSSTDTGMGIAVDAAGSAYVTGTTNSSNFPTRNAYQSSLRGSSDAFVAKLSPAGDALVYGTFLGGSSDDHGTAIAVDASGSVYVVGQTFSSGAFGGTAFPTLNAYQSSFSGMSFADAFVTKFKPDGSGLVYSTFLGGTNNDAANAVAVDASGQAYVTGFTGGGNFPTTAGAYKTSWSGGQAAFVTKLSASGSSLGYSTYLGGTSGTNAGNGIAVDSSGQAYVAGSTQATNFATTAGAYQTSLSGGSGQDAFVTRLNAAGSALGWSTYLGGGVTDSANGIAVDGSGDAYVAGSTTSTNFPTVSPYQSSLGGGSGTDAFVSELAPGGGSLLYSTYLGGSGTDQANGIALDADANISVAGQTASTNFPTLSAAQSSSGGGSNDAFVARFAQLAAPVLTSIDQDTGASASDQVTNDQTLTLYGTAIPNATVTLYRGDIGSIGAVTASSAGLFTFSYTGTTLAQGSYAFTATASAGGKTSGLSTPFLVSVDTTNPTVTLTAPASTVDPNAQLIVTATDNFGLPASTTVTLDVDTDNDGDFTDSGESGYQTATATNGVAVFNLSPALAAGTYPLRARVDDLAGNHGTSAVTTMVLSASGSSWTLTDTTPQIDPLAGDATFQRGVVLVNHPLDLGQSPDAAVAGNPALVYSSERVSVQPVIQASVQSDSSVALPATISVQLTFNGTAQTAQSFSTTGLSQGDLITVAQQVSTPVTSAGAYPYTLTVTMNYATPIVRTLSGIAYLDAEGSSPFGAGWTLAPVDRLVSIAATLTYSAGLLRVYGDGSGVAFYASNGAGGYNSPAGDAGTLSAVGGGYQYKSPDGSLWNFNSSGLETSLVSADGLSTIAYSYTGSNLTGISTPDGALTTISYSSTQDTIKTGSRTVTLTLNSGTNNLTGIADPDGGLRTFTYDASHRLTQDQFGVLNGTYSYSSGQESGYTPGNGGASAVSPYDLYGLSAAVATPFFATLTDPLGRVTRKSLDSSGRPLETINPDGGITLDVRNGQGWVTQETDPMGRVTTFTLDSSGFPTQVTLPDGNTQKYQYQAAFHALTQYTDENGNIWTYTFDSGGHLLTEKDPLGNVTSYTYYSSTGLLQSVEDALGRFTTYSYDADRRLSTVTDALGNVSTTTYDTNGFVATQVDALGRVTTFSNDALGRALTVTDALGDVTSHTYSGSGQELTTTDALGRVTDEYYNGQGLLTMTLMAAGTGLQQSAINAFDGAGEETSTRDAAGNYSYTNYGANGQVSGTTDALGDPTQNYYDLDGELIKSVDARGASTTYAYNVRGWLTSTTDALGNRTTTTYDAVGNTLTVTDALGNVTSYSYDKLNQLTVQTDAYGSSVAASMTTVYDAVGNTIQTYDALGRVTSYAYDALNRVTTMTVAVGTADQQVTSYVYDKVGNQTSMTDPRGLVTSSTYDKLNRLTVQTQAYGSSVAATNTSVYDAVGNLLSLTNALAQITSYGYDALNRQTTEIDAYGSGVPSTLTTIYDATGNGVGAENALGQTAVTAFDQVGRPIFSIDPLGNASRSYLDASGNVVRSVDALGNSSSAGYDALGRQTTNTDALSNVGTTVYDNGGNVLVSIDARGNRTTFTYDALNRQVTMTTTAGTITTVYDKVGNVVQTIDAAGNITSYTYDNVNRQVTVKDPGLGVLTTVYDGDNNVVNTIDQMGNKATYTYDSLNRQATAVDARGGTTSYAYDLLGNRTNLIDSDSNKTTFVYDAQNRLTEETDPLGHSMTYAYNAAGQTTSQTDRLGQRRNFSYDADGRLTQEVWVNGSGTVVNTLVYGYDSNGNQLTGGDSHGTYTMAYDALNRVSSMQGLYGTLLTFGYDAAGNRNSIKDNFGGVLTSVYDSAERLSSQQYNNGTNQARFDLTYTSRNQVATLTRYSDVGGTTKIGESDYGYDSAGRLQTLQAKNGSGTTLENFTYTYDLASRVTSQQVNGATTSYQYDATNQLTSDGVKSYSYDANGNRTMTGYQTGTGNQLTSDGVYSYSYDANGNLIKKTKGASAETWTFSYDNRNQLVGVQERATDGGTLLVQATYVYDVFNNRIEDDEWASGGTTTVTKTAYDDQGQAWADLTSGNVLQTRYLSMPGQVAPVARVASGAVNWLVTDRLGSVVNVLDGSGNLIDTLTYNGFGNTITESNASVTGNYTFTGLIYLRNEGALAAKNRLRRRGQGRWGDARWTTGGCAGRRPNISKGTSRASVTP
jgi:YD repeat-containing protein